MAKILTTVGKFALLCLALLLFFVAMPPAPRPAHAAHVVAVQSGFWNDPATWGGAVPNDYDTVTIPAPITVYYNSDVYRNNTTTIEAGATLALGIYTMTIPAPMTVYNNSDVYRNNTTTIEAEATLALGIDEEGPPMYTYPAGFGTFTTYSTLYNYGNIHNVEPAPYMPRHTYAMAFFQNSGTVYNYGIVINGADSHYDPGYNTEFLYFFIENAGQFYNYGTFENAGYVNVWDTIHNYGSFASRGYGFVYNIGGPYNLINHCGGTLTGRVEYPPANEPCPSDHESDDASIFAVGAWDIETIDGTSGGTASCADGPNAALVQTFDGDDIEIVHVEQAGAGSYAIMVDGGVVAAPIDTDNGGAPDTDTQSVAVVYGHHTLSIRVLTGRVCIDQVRFGQDPLQLPPNETLIATEDDQPLGSTTASGSCNNATVIYNNAYDPSSAEHEYSAVYLSGGEVVLSLRFTFTPPNVGGLYRVGITYHYPTADLPVPGYVAGDNAGDPLDPNNTQVLIQMRNNATSACKSVSIALNCDTRAATIVQNSDTCIFPQ